MKDEILDLYFNKKLKQNEIAKKLNVAKSTVSKIISRDVRYTAEKANRKVINKEKHNKQIQDCIERKRKQKQFNSYMDDLIMKRMHIEASMELSGGKKPISNRAFRDWNPSIYEFNEKNKSYVLKKGINVGADVPKKISWKNY